MCVMPMYNKHFDNVMQCKKMTPFCIDYLELVTKLRIPLQNATLSSILFAEMLLNVGCFIEERLD